MTLYFWRERQGWSTRLWWSREGSEESRDRQPRPSKMVRKRSPRSGMELGDGLTYMRRAGSAPLTQPGGKDPVQRRCYCHTLAVGQLVEPKPMFLLANTQGFWLTGALTEHWCHSSRSHTECHAWTRLRGAPAANDLDPGLEGKDRQTGAYFFIFSLEGKRKGTGAFCREGSCGSCLWRQGEMEAKSFLASLFQKAVRWWWQGQVG